MKDNAFWLSMVYSLILNSKTDIVFSLLFYLKGKMNVDWYHHFVCVCVSLLTQTILMIFTKLGIEFVKLEWHQFQLLYGPQMGYGSRASKNMHFYVGVFLYNVKYEQLGSAKVFFNFWFVDNKYWTTELSTWS